MFQKRYRSSNSDPLTIYNLMCICNTFPLCLSVRLPVVCRSAGPHCPLSGKEKLSGSSLHQRLWRSVLLWHQEVPQRHLHLWWVPTHLQRGLHFPTTRGRCSLTDQPKVLSLMFYSSVFSELQATKMGSVILREELYMSFQGMTISVEKGQ